MINATVSHEIRNPLNSIVAINMQKEELYNDLKRIMNNQQIGDELKKEKQQEILNKLDVGNDIQQSSSKLIQYLVQDLLDFS